MAQLLAGGGGILRILALTVSVEDAGRRVGALLSSRFQISRGQMSRLKFNAGLFLDGQPVHSNERVREGQHVEARLTEKDRPRILPYALPLNVPYEDEDILVVDKPAPLPSVSSPRQSGETLENAVFHYLGCPDKFVYRPVNRLDKGTSGLMAVAKNAHAHQRMQAMLHTEDYLREYLAVVRGQPDPPRGTVSLPIGLAGGVMRCVTDKGRDSYTLYESVRRGEEASLVRLRLVTGRTHQIRVHMSAIGCPVVGDYLYGNADLRLPGRFALHSCLISCLHPISRRQLRLESPLPPDLEVLL
jgi:23S rRNA pseudouridine1911/1915/1917 synthase